MQIHPSPEPETQELPIDRHGPRTTAQRRLSELATAIRTHERSLAQRPYTVRYADLRLYRRLRQISGGLT
jgi:hypothetical protein